MKLLNYRNISDVMRWRNKGNATMGKCIIISCAVSLFLVKFATFHGRHL